MTDHVMPTFACLDCGMDLDRAFTAEGPRPRDGDFSVCAYCGHLAVFNAELGFREPTDADIVEIAGDPALIEAQNLRALWKASQELGIEPQPGVRETDAKGERLL